MLEVSTQLLRKYKTVNLLYKVFGHFAATVETQVPSFSHKRTVSSSGAKKASWANIKLSEFVSQNCTHLNLIVDV